MPMKYSTRQLKERRYFIHEGQFGEGWINEIKMKSDKNQEGQKWGQLKGDMDGLIERYMEWMILKKDRSVSAERAGWDKFGELAERWCVVCGQFTCLGRCFACHRSS